MGIQLCGGHTEITSAVNGMILSGHLIGIASAGTLVLKCRAEEGDDLLLTKSLAIEGTCILAHEFSNRLLGLDVPREILQSGRNLLNSAGISILTPQRTLTGVDGDVSGNAVVVTSDFARVAGEENTTWAVRVWAEPTGSFTDNLVTFWATDQGGRTLALFARSTNLPPPP